MHRFYMFHSFKNYHRNVMAPCFLFLSAKVEEQPRKLEHVLRVAHTCLKGDKDEPSLDPKSNEYMKLSQDLINNESVVLQTLGFELSVEHPHTYVVKCAQLVKASKDLAQTSYFLATNSLHLTTFCIQYKPTVVACICIYVSCKWANWEIMESQDKKNWWEYIDNTVTPELLEDLSSHFIKILDNSQTRLKKRIASGPLVYKGGVLQQKKHKEEGKPDDAVRKHHNGNMDGQRVGSMEHPRMTRLPQDAHSVDDAKTMHSISRSKINSSSAGGAGSDVKDSRRSSELGSASSLRQVEQASHYAKRPAESMKGHRTGQAKSESGDLRGNSVSHHAEKVHGRKEDTSEKSVENTIKPSLDSKEKHTYFAQHQGKSTDSVPKMPTSTSQSATAPTLKHTSTMDAYLRHSSPMKRPRAEGESQAGPTESRTSFDAHTKHGHVKSDPDSKKPTNHHLYKHKQAKPSSHHRHDTKPSLSDSDKLKYVQHSSSHKSTTHKHSYVARDSSSTSTRPSSMPKHGSHVVPTGNRPVSQTSKSPIMAKSVAKKPKLDSSDSLLPPPPPPPSFPHAILNNTTVKGDTTVMKALPGTQSQSTSSSNPAMASNLNNVPSQYRDFFMGGLPEIPLTDLLPPPPPPSTSSLNATPSSPPPPPPPPRS